MLMCLGQANGVAALAARNYAERFPLRRHPDVNVIRRLEQRVRERGQVNPIHENLGRPRTVRTPDLEEGILAAVHNSPSRSVRGLAREFGADIHTVHDIIREEHYYPFRYCLVQSLLPGDAAPRLQFCQWLLERHNDDLRFVSRVLWSDEAIFTRDGVFNRKNNHIWAVENPHVLRSRAHQQRFQLNVWAGIIGGHLLGPHFLPPRLNANNFLEFLQEDFFNLVENIPLNLRQNMWLQLDGAPAHFAQPVRNWLNETFPGRWIGRGAAVSWPPRSPDLNPLDFFLWGFIKNRVYATEVVNLQQLEERIRAAFAEVNAQMLDRMQLNIIRRAEICIDSNGRNFEHLL